jgi:hypothetical protein
MSPVRPQSARLFRVALAVGLIGLLSAALGTLDLRHAPSAQAAQPSTWGNRGSDHPAGRTVTRGVVVPR